MKISLAAAIVAATFVFTARAQAHCDTLDGPVVKDAKTALDKGEVTAVLKWLKPEHEAEVKSAFARALAVRTRGDDARELADTYFFETLVRLHRAGEGAAYTGLKPAGSEVEPAIKAADEAIAHHSADAVVKTLNDQLAQNVRRLFEQVMERQPHASENVEAGRAFVAAYVQFIHYVERVHQAIAAANATHGHDATPAHAEHKSISHNH